jgi:hypothetical protein
VFKGQAFAERYVIHPLALRTGNLDVAASSLARESWLGGADALRYFRLSNRYAKRGRPIRAMEQYELSPGMQPRVESLRQLVVLYDWKGDAAGFASACDRLFEIDYVDRPSATPNIDSYDPAIHADFRTDCIRVARTVRPEAIEARAVPQDGRVPGYIPDD